MSTGVTLASCTAGKNDGYGFRLGTASTIMNSTAHDNILDGFQVECGRVENCTASKNTMSGFTLKERSQIRGSLATDNGANGITAGSHCQVVGNHSAGNGKKLNAGAGIMAATQSHSLLLADNTCVANDIGMFVGGRTQPDRRKHLLREQAR